jgi:hypothetical protein
MGGWVPCACLAHYDFDNPRLQDPRFALNEELVKTGLALYAKAKGYATYKDLLIGKEKGQKIERKSCKYWPGFSSRGSI